MRTTSEDNLSISVITATFNSAETICRCLDSSLNQPYPNFEHIVVDGASKDGTVDILRSYSKGNPKLMFISEPDKGIYDALNKGVALATGEYLIIIGSDDWLEEGALQRAAEYLECNRSVQILSGKIIKHYGSRIIHQISDPKSCSRRYHMPINHVASFIKRSVYEKIGNFSSDFSIAADYEFVLRALRQGVSIVPFDCIITHFTCGGMSSNLNHIPKLNRELLAIRKKYLSSGAAALLYSYEQLFVFMRMQKRKWFKIS